MPQFRGLERFDVVDWGFVDPIFSWKMSPVKGADAKEMEEPKAGTYNEFVLASEDHKELF